MLDGVDAPVREADDLVEDGEGGLERGELDEGLYGLCVGFAGLEDLFATSAETS